MWQVHLMFLLGLFNLVLHGSVRTLLIVCISHTATYQSFHIYQCSVVWGLFLKKNIILCCRCHGLAAELEGAVLPLGLPQTLGAVFSHLWYLQNHRVFWITTAELFPALGTKAFFFSVKYLPPNQIFPKRNISKKTKFYASFFVKWNTRQNNLSFTLDILEEI